MRLATNSISSYKTKHGVLKRLPTTRTSNYPVPRHLYMKQGLVTPMCAVLTAKTGHRYILTHTLRKGWSHFAFFHILLGQRTNVGVVNSHWLTSSTVKQSRAILQCGLLAVHSSTTSPAACHIAQQFHVPHWQKA